MYQFLLQNKNNNGLSIFENNNFYNISFNKNINGWLKIIFINNTINIYMSIDNMDGYILWQAYINEYNFININLICSETSGVFSKNNINYSKLLIIFPINVKNLNDFENYLENADFLYKINFDEKNMKEEINKQNNTKETPEINLDKINKIKIENNKILNIDDLILDLIKSIKSSDLINKIKLDDKILNIDSFLDIVKQIKNHALILDIFKKLNII